MPTKSARRAWLLAAGLAAIAACTPMPLARPQLIAGSETTVTLTSGQWVDAQNAANRYCAQFDREAIRRGRSTLDASNLTSMWIFDCVERDP